MLAESEKFRQVVEEYDSEKHDKYIAEKTIAQYEDSDDFNKF